MPFRPMLSGKAKDAVLRFPLLASPKLDGIRCLAMDGRPMSRSMKVLPNQHVRDNFEFFASKLNGLDGELIVGSPTDSTCIQNTTSGVMSHDGNPDFRYYVFDVWNSDAPFQDRLEMAHQRVQRCPDWVCFVGHTLVNSEDELLEYESAILALGYEGVMLRDPRGSYKQGRSTAKEGGLLKLKRFEDAEGEIVGYEEKRHNANEATTDERGYTKRSTHQDNKIGMDTLGTLLVRVLNGRFAGQIARIGSGFNHDLALQIWRNQPGFMRRIVKFKFFDHGAKDAPRHGVFLTFRDPLDMVA